MPTTNKRVNLTIPENIYERLLAYKQKNGIASDSSACLQLIVRQLDSMEQAEMMLKVVSRFNPDELKELSNLSFDALRQGIERNKKAE